MRTIPVLVAASLVVAFFPVGSAVAQDWPGASAYSSSLADSLTDSMPLVPPDTSPMGAAPTGGGPFWDPAGGYEEGFHPRWTFEAGALMLHRSRPEHAVLMSDAFAPGGNVLVDAADFDFDLRGGFEVGLVHRNLLGSIWDLEARYFRVDGWAVRAGYQVLWLEGVATASNQIAASVPVGGTARVDATGGLFYHGALVSLEFSR
jgi:hypothetical protein